ncbi:MAG: pilus assembly protein PilP [Methylotetracoccus sp.]|jgi:type IV pilus assembly protein PilP|nr:pilus assembly protein PilP [Methylotetracoccus sp.]
MFRDVGRPVGLMSLSPAALVVMMSLLAACSEDNFGDLQEYVTEVRSRKKEPVAALPVPKTAEPFLFRVEQIQDPFRRTQRDDEAGDAAQCSANRPDPNRAKEELESFELDALRMVGTIRLHGELWGLVQAKDATIHRVRTGTYMGLRLGRVVAVEPDRIELIEQVEQRSCVWEERQASLDLTEPADRR